MLFSEEGYRAIVISELHMLNKSKITIINIKPMPKQQTALREAIDKLEVEYMESITRSYSNGLSFAIKILKSLLPKERQQIEDAYNAGMSEFGNRQATPCHTDIESSDYFTKNFEQ